jgi:PAS domain S-box-containing protein
MVPPAENQDKAFRSRGRAIDLDHHVPVGHFLVDVEGAVQEADQAGLQLLGEDVTSLLGTPFSDHVYQDDADLFTRHLQQVFESPPTRTCELRLIGKEGIVFDSLLESSVGSGPEGRHDRCWLAVHDITLIKLIRKIVSLERKYSESIISSTFDGIIAFDSIYQCTEWNPAMEQMTGISRNESLGKNIFENLPFLKRIGEDRYYAAALQGRKVTSRNRHYSIRRTGREGFFDARYAPLKDNSGELSGGIAIVRDITVQKRQGEELLKANKYESLSLLASGIAHDFNNLLAGILGNISLARLHMKQGDKTYELVDKAIKIVHRASELTRQLTLLSSEVEPVKRPVFIAKLLKNAAAFTLSGSPIGCEFAIDDTLWPVEIDEGQIRQAVHTIIIYLNKSLRTGGKIALAAKNAVIARDSALPLLHGKYVLISISDYGSNTSSDNILTQRDPFGITAVEGDQIRKSAELSMAYSIISNHEGLITVESAVEGGTAIVIFLPATEKTVVEQEVKTPLALAGKGRILIMDDEDDVRDIAGKILSYIGYEVALAQDGEDALRAYMDAINSERSFDAVILDLTVQGGMGGKETLLRLLDIDPEVKAIVSSGYSRDPVMSEFNKFGFKGAIAKPFKIGELNEILSKAME